MGSLGDVWPLPWAAAAAGYKLVPWSTDHSQLLISHLLLARASNSQILSEPTRQPKNSVVISLFNKPRCFYQLSRALFCIIIPKAFGLPALPASDHGQKGRCQGAKPDSSAAIAHLLVTL